MKNKKNLVVLDENIGKVKRTPRGKLTIDDVRRKAVIFSGLGFLGVILLLLVTWGVISVVTDIITPDKGHVGNFEDDSEFGDGDASVLLFIKMDDEKAHPEQLVLTRFEPSEEKVYVCALPVGLSIGGSTLSGRYSEKGLSGLTGAVGDLAGCKNIGTVSADYDQLRKLINSYDGVNITVNENINYKSEKSERNIIAGVGTRVYSGGEAARLLNYPNWQGGKRAHAGMYAMVVRNLINENLICTGSEGIKKLLTGIHNSASTDITQTRLQRHMKGLLHLCSVNKGDVAIQLDIWPEENADGSLTYNENDLALLLAAFSDRDEA